MQDYINQNPNYFAKRVESNKRKTEKKLSYKYERLKDLHNCRLYEISKKTRCEKNKWRNVSWKSGHKVLCSHCKNRHLSDIHT